MNEKKCHIVALLPIYDETLWFEQLVDYLGAYPYAKILVPNIVTTTNTKVDDRFLRPLFELLQNYAQLIEYTVVVSDNATLFNTSYVGYHEEALELIYQYLKSNERFVYLQDMNNNLSWTLGRQYIHFLPPEIHSFYRQLQQQYVLAILQNIAMDEYIIIVPIDHAEYVYNSLQQACSVDYYGENTDNSEKTT